ncbi:MAG: glycosyltransferase, partial [Erysipelotrichaceae bacterium]|nr:glycosyltransferase [Erysipelotrichaceae bacterium]
EQRDTVFQKAIRKQDTKIYYLPELTVKAYLKLMRLTDEFFRVHAREYDIVHLTYPGQVGMVLKPAKKYGVPYRIIHSFNTRLSDNPLKSIRNKLFIMNYKKYANVYLACSKNAGEYLYGKKMAESGEVTYIMNAINCEEYRFDEQRRAEMRNELGIWDDTKLFLAVGRLEEQKNIGFAVDVFSEVLKKDSASRLIIIGDGPLKPSIMENVSDYGINDSVVFAGFTNRLNDYFNAADILLFPSLYEGLPITVIDAQCGGLPCVLSDTISDEVVLTDLVHMRSLNDTPAEWADTCLSACSTQRRDYTDEITKKGYNIAKEALRLEQLCLDLGE